MYKGFPKKLVPALVCQSDGSSLILEYPENNAEEYVVNGQLCCSACGRKYQIKDGIVNMMIDEKLDEPLVTEIKARDKDAKKYDSKLLARSHKEIPSTLNSLGNISGKKIIEYGCGTGIFTVLLSEKCENILAVDFSVQSLLFMQDKKKGQKNIGLVQADAVQFISKDEFFDIAFSAQVYEHIPTLDQRIKHLQNINKTIKPRGIVLFTAYHQDLRRKIKGMSQEGRHANGIFYHFFTGPEIENEFSRFFKITELKPIDITWPLEARVGLPGSLKEKLSSFAEKIPLIRELGHLILVKANK